EDTQPGGPPGRQGAERNAECHAADDARDEPRLADREHDAEHHQRRAVGEGADGDGERRQQGRLEDEEPESCAPRLPPDEHHGGGQRGEHEEIADRAHRSRNTAVTDRSASANEPASSSGTRKSRSFAMLVSSTASAVVRTASLPTTAAVPWRMATGVRTCGTPHGKNRFASSVRKSRSFIADVHSTSAR